MGGSGAGRGCGKLCRRGGHFAPDGRQFARKTRGGIQRAATSFPPGTDPRLSTYILETVGLEVTAVQDEPTCVANLLELDRTAVVDVGGGTTGTAVALMGKVVFSGDQPTCRRHISLVIAGRYGIFFQEAEEFKRRPSQYDIRIFPLSAVPGVRRWANSDRMNWRICLILSSSKFRSPMGNSIPRYSYLGFPMRW